MKQLDIRSGIKKELAVKYDINCKLLGSLRVAQQDKALGYRSGGHAFESCNAHIRYALLVN